VVEVLAVLVSGHPFHLEEEAQHHGAAERGGGHGGSLPGALAAIQPNHRPARAASGSGKGPIALQQMTVVPVTFWKVRKVAAMDPYEIEAFDDAGGLRWGVVHTEPGVKPVPLSGRFKNSTEAQALAETLAAAEPGQRKIGE
jgi:hypothetical protein